MHDGDGVGHGAGFLGGVGDEDGGDVLTADAVRQSGCAGGGAGGCRGWRRLRPRATATGA